MHNLDYILVVLSCILQAQMNMHFPGRTTMEEFAEGEPRAQSDAMRQLLAQRHEAEAAEVRRRIMHAAEQFDNLLADAAGKREATLLAVASGAAAQLQLLREIAVLRVREQAHLNVQCRTSRAH